MERVERLEAEFSRIAKFAGAGRVAFSDVGRTETRTVVSCTCDNLID